MTISCKDKKIGDFFEKEGTTDVVAVDSIPKMTPQEVPGQVPQAVPQATPQATPQLVPNAVPNAIPQKGASPYLVPTIKDGKTAKVKGKYLVLRKTLSASDKYAVKVIRGISKQEGKDMFVYLTIETKEVLVFKNGVFIGEIKQ